MRLTAKDRTFKTFRPNQGTASGTVPNRRRLSLWITRTVPAELSPRTWRTAWQRWWVASWCARCLVTEPSRWPIERSAEHLDTAHRRRFVVPQRIGDRSPITDPKPDRMRKELGEIHSLGNAGRPHRRVLACAGWPTHPAPAFDGITTRSMATRARR